MCLNGCLECWCATDESKDLWDAEIGLIVERYKEVVESRSIDAGHEVLQISTRPFELKRSESRENRTCCRRRTLGFPVMVGLKRLESKGKFVEAGQRGKAS